MTDDRQTIPGLVSIIVASYNHASFLNQRMDSLINQTYKDVEIIVIDDCSTDDSRAILQNYSSNPKVNIVLNKENLGWVGVSNKGLSLAKGEFIIFANCDDYADTLQIQKLIDPFFSNENLSMSFSTSYLVDEKNNIICTDYVQRESAFKNYCNNRNTLIKKEMFIKFLMHSCVIPNLSGVLMRKQFFIASDGFSEEYKVVSDWDLFFKVATFGDVYWISEPLNYFRQHDETIRASTKDRVIYNEIFSLLLSEIKKNNFTYLERIKSLNNIACIWANYIIRSPKSAVRNLFHHLKLTFSSSRLIPFILLIQVIFLPVKIILRLPYRIKSA